VALLCGEGYTSPGPGVTVVAEVPVLQTEERGNGDERGAS